MTPAMMKTALLTFTLILAASPALCGNILIPGYDTLHFKAGKIEQEVLFRNPEENTCCFRMSLTLSNGLPVWTADDVLNPGEAFLRIDLERKLAPGTYRNAVMKYECYSLEDMSRLNGAEIRVTIEAE